MRTIYADILICVNLFVNYFLLLAVAGVIKTDFSRKRLVLGSAVGAVCSLSILLNLSPFLLLLVRAAISSAIILCAFGFKTPALFLRRLGLFYIVTFAFAGIMLFLFSAFKIGGTVRNSVVYINISPVVLIGVTVGCYLLLCLLSRLIKTGDFNKNSSCAVEITVEGRSKTVDVMCDSGNLLTEIFSGYPVIILNEECLPGLLSDNAVSFFTGESDVPPQDFAARVRMIPCGTVKGSTVLPAFRPDSVTVKSSGGSRTTSKIYAAVCKNTISGGQYLGVINPDSIL
ncbi:MAG: sigma-E processing peptidase SpoIIGA [Clostridia bacterium]|nr:sigma-E processing peptidase SpoIIGA [Clostridia bacterium]